MNYSGPAAVGFQSRPWFAQYNYSQNQVMELHPLQNIVRKYSIDVWRKRRLRGPLPARSRQISIEEIRTKLPAYINPAIFNAFNSSIEPVSTRIAPKRAGEPGCSPAESRRLMNHGASPRRFAARERGHAENFKSGWPISASSKPGQPLAFALPVASMLPTVLEITL
jgi:hypothetical protein